MRLGAVKTVLLRELWERTADRKALVLSFALPLVLVTIVGFALSPAYGGGGSSPIRLGFVDEAGNEFSGALGRELERSGLRLIRSAPGGVSLDEAGARKMVRDGKLGAALVVPGGYPGILARADVPEVRYEPSGEFRFDAARWRDFWIALSRGGAKLRLLRNPGRAIEAGTVTGLVQRAAYVTLFGELGERLRRRFDLGGAEQEAPDAETGDFLEKLVAVEAEDVVGQKKKGRFDAFAHALPGFALMFLLFAALESASLLIRDREQGVMARILSFPVSVGDLFAGKSIAVMLAGVLQLAVLFAAGSLMFGVRVWGSPAGLGLMCAAAGFFASGLGMFVFSVSGTLRQANSVTLILVLVLSALGGCWFPSFLMPEWMREIASLTPTYWAMDGFAKLIWFGKGIESVWANAAMLAAAGAVLSAAARFISARKSWK